MGIGITGAWLAVEINLRVTRSFKDQDPLILRADLDGQVAAPASEVKRPLQELPGQLASGGPRHF